jgi:hypothetical protein
LPDDKSAAEKKLAEVLPPFEAGPPPEEPEKVIPKKGSDGYETPSGYALAKVGEFKGEAGSDEAREHGIRYLVEKVKKRWGYGS